MHAAQNGTEDFPCPFPSEGYCRDSCQVPAVPNDIIWRLSVDQYHEMIRTGILTADDPVELLEGWLVYKMPKKPVHRLVTQVLRGHLEDLLPDGCHVNVQEPITTNTSEPEPDVSVVCGQRHDYRDRHPGPQDLGLVVEVSDTTLERDQGWKKSVYAQARIAVYWIINLVARRIEVYEQPGEGSDYQIQRVYEANDEVLLVLDNKTLGSVVLGKLLDGEP